MSTLLGRAFIAPIRFYQQAISPLLPPSCRFLPTCSAYAVEAIQVHGAIKGTAYAVLRLLKCGPWHRGGYDPVKPPRNVRPAAGTAPHRPDHSTATTGENGES